MLPAEAVLLAARRWLDLLQRSDLATARALIRADSDHRRLTSTQYATALEWLAAVGLLVDGPDGLAAAPEIIGLDIPELDRQLLQRSLEHAAPPWLADADLHVPTPNDLPADVAQLAAMLGLDEAAAFAAVRQVHGRVDLSERSRVGAAGERGLVQLLEQLWPGAVIHIALQHDGFGYDIQLNLGDGPWHLEIKSTTRAGRSVIYLSRHEYEVAQHDRRWRLLLVRLDTTDSVAAIATVDQARLWQRAPQDSGIAGRWESARFDIHHDELRPGLDFLPLHHRSESSRLLFPAAPSNR